MIPVCGTYVDLGYKSSRTSDSLESAAAGNSCRALVGHNDHKLPSLQRLRWYGFLESLGDELFTLLATSSLHSLWPVYRDWDFSAEGESAWLDTSPSGAGV